MSIEQILDKFIVIDGDCSEIGAGISESNRKLIADNVTIVYHLSANIQFDEVNS